MKKVIKYSVIGIIVLLFGAAAIKMIMQEPKEIREKKTIDSLLSVGNVDSSLVLLKSIESKSENYNWASTKIDSIQSIKDSVKSANFTKGLRNQIESIKSGNDYSKYYQSKETISNVVALFGARTKLIKEAREGENEEDKILAEELEKLNREVQFQEFPKIRKAFYENIKQDLWKDDIEVALKGDRNQTLDFTGAIFASNRGIDKVQTALVDVFKLYRFTRIQYRWSDMAREYDYYDLTVPADQEKVVFN